MNWLGDFPEDFATVAIFFTTHDANGAPLAPLSAFEADDVKIYKNGDAAQKATTNGLTMTSPFDTITGLHRLLIDTGNDTGDASFWVPGATYTVVLNPDTETVNGQVVLKVVGSFGIELAAGGGAAPTASEIADEVQTRTIAAVTTVNGLANNSVTAAALADDAGTEIGTAVWATTERLLTAGTNIALAKGTGVTGFNDLDAAGVRTAIGLASANLDTQLDALPTNSELTAAIAAGDDATLSAIAALNNLSAAAVNAEVDTALADVGLTTTITGRIDAAITTRMATYTQPTGFLAATFPSDPADQSLVIAATDALAALIGDVPTNTELATALGTADDAVLAQVALVKAKTDLIPAAPAAVGDIPTANQNADALLGRADAIETGLTPAQSLRLIAAASAGKLSVSSNTVTIRNVGDSKNRITATTDSNGQRTAVTTDAT